MPSLCRLPLLFMACVFAMTPVFMQAAVELPLGDGRRLVLEIDERDWLIEQEMGLPYARVQLRGGPAGSRVIAGFEVTDRVFSDELVEQLRREHVAYLVRKGVEAPVLQDLEVRDGAGFTFSWKSGSTGVAAPPADFGYIILRSGITLSYYAGPSDGGSEWFHELETALRHATVTGEIDEVLVATTADGEIIVTLSFEIGLEGAATRVTVDDSENPAFNGLAVKQVLGRKFRGLRSGRRYVQPVVIRLADHVGTIADRDEPFVPPLPLPEP